jgi:membrane fusion protein, multidrug efflux system
MAARRWRTGWILGALCVTAAAIAALFIYFKRPAKVPAPPPIPVSVAVASTRDVPVSISALGAAQAWTSVTVMAQVTGALLTVDFAEGSDVKAGQLLAQVDPAPYKAALTQARGALERDSALLAGARVDLVRYETLVAQDSIARQMAGDQAALVKQYEGTVLLDQGAVETAQVNLRWCRIVSPINGRAGVRMIDPGNLVTAGSSGSTTSGTTGATTTPVGIVVINQIEPIAVTFSIPQDAYERLWQASSGFHKPLATQAFSQQTGALLGSGELRIANNRVDPTTGTVEMKARFANGDERLLPGQFVNVVLTLQTLTQAVTIPETAVNHGPNGAFAFVVGSDQKVSMRAIKVGPTQDATTVITSGLKAGETVVIDGQMSLDTGSLVKVAQPASTPQPAS